MCTCPLKTGLAYVNRFRDMARVLGVGRYGVAWEAAGVAAGAFELALKYTKEREQFGKPIAGFQLIQQKLVEMATEVTLMQTLCVQLSHLISRGLLTEGTVSHGEVQQRSQSPLRHSAGARMPGRQWHRHRQSHRPLDA